jgi:GTP-binding protein
MGGSFALALSMLVTASIFRFTMSVLPTFRQRAISSSKIPLFRPQTCLFASVSGGKKRSATKKGVPGKKAASGSRPNKSDLVSQHSCSSAASSKKEEKKDLPEHPDFLAFRNQMRVFRAESASKKLLVFVKSIANGENSDQAVFGSMTGEKLLLAYRTLQRMKPSRGDLLPDIMSLFLGLPYSADCDEAASLRVGASFTKAAGILGYVELAEAAAMKSAQLSGAVGGLGLGVHLSDPEILEPSKQSDRESTAMVRIILLQELALAYVRARRLHDAEASLALLSSEISLVREEGIKKVLRSVVEGNEDPGELVSQRRKFLRVHLTAAVGVNLALNSELSRQLFRAALDFVDLDQARALLRVLVRCGGLDDVEGLQMVAQTFLQDVDFLRGAVSIETLPPPITGASEQETSVLNRAGLIPEIIFIGRSNVGKSSLINMVANRKALAYTSKTPGKTSEFNYFRGRTKRFAGNSGSDRVSGPSSEPTVPLESTNVAVSNPAEFYLVDMPGVGFAKTVGRNTREGWVDLLDRLCAERAGLRAVCHLIDARHGPLAVDDSCFDLLLSLPPHVQYVVVLTKVDKLARKTGVKPSVVEEIQARIQKRLNARRTTVEQGEGVAYTRSTPIMMTSSETKRGGSALWSVLLDSMAGEDAESMLRL